MLSYASQKDFLWGVFVEHCKQLFCFINDFTAEKPVKNRH